MISKFLSGAALSVTLATANMASVFANATTNLKTSNGITVNSVAPKSSLIEIEGRTLTDSEAAMVEGEAAFFVAPAAILTLLKIAAASATKTAVIGFGKLALKGAIIGGRFIITSGTGAVIGQFTLSQLQRMGFRF